tara:strand:- start:343 stop:1239 length:897 start_codon:yes stop_codon:yes gene_type:complete
MILIILFLFILVSCESLIYKDYTIIDIGKSKSAKSNQNNTNQYYKVTSGDNLYSISRKFKIPIQDLIKVNNISQPYKIFPNQKIYIPINQIHKIEKGDTLYSISRKYQTNVFHLSELNNISNVNNIKVGQDLVIPFQNSKKIKPKKRKKLFKKDKKIISKEQNLKTVNNQHTHASNRRFIWPVKGKIIAKYGESKKGFYNDGINIDSKEGTRVLSSDDGQVIYSGNEIPGYGNLILIKHNKNWITAYAHLNEVFTKKGRKVKKGEKIGSVGNTGNVRIPQLHFEIRKGKESVDPLKLL